MNPAQRGATPTQSLPTTRSRASDGANAVKPNRLKTAANTSKILSPAPCEGAPAAPGSGGNGLAVAGHLQRSTPKERRKTRSTHPSPTTPCPGKATGRSTHAHKPVGTLSGQGYVRGQVMCAGRSCARAGRVRRQVVCAGRSCAWARDNERPKPSPPCLGCLGKVMYVDKLTGRARSLARSWAPTKVAHPASNQPKHQRTPEIERPGAAMLRPARDDLPVRKR